jgi:phage-related minor tail protein
LIKAILKLVIMQSILKALNISTPIGAGTGGGFNFLEFLFRGFKAKKFATGGIVTGPTFGMVGEAGPEAVLPLSYLNNLVASIGGSANLQARVSGQDLLFVMERAGRVNNRTF